MSLFDDHGGGPDDERPSPQRPETPYAGTSGWSGSDTSRERAAHDDTSGVTGARQRATLTLLLARGAVGATWREVADETGWHHGTVSGALSVLHKERHIARLTETRQRCKVYVHASFVDDRPTEPFAPNTQKRRDLLAVEIADRLVQYLDARRNAQTQSQVWTALRELVAQYREADQ